VPLAGIAPKLVRRVYDLCRQQNFVDARDMQESIAHLQPLVLEAGASGLKDGLAGIKCAMAVMGRECGVPRPPVRPLGEVERGRFEEAVQSLAFLKTEPHGW